MSYAALKAATFEANKAIVEAGLVLLTWGNASAADRAAGVMAIKPSGVSYDTMRAEDMVVLSLETGEVVEGDLRPSSDTPTHLYLYQQFAGLGGVVHTHSTHATAWAQSGKPLPCFGTTHADHFYGAVPTTRAMREAEIKDAYEHNTGVVIVECFREADIDPDQVPGVLVHSHGPFTWGADVKHAVENSIVLEEAARMGLITKSLTPEANGIDQVLLDKHFLRKHGKGAYYGQK